MKIFKIIILATIVLPLIAIANEKEDHLPHSKGEGAKHSEHAEKETESTHKDHADGDHDAKESAEESESNPQVGEGKGIVSASEKLGFKLSPEAEKNFEIKKIKISNLKSIEIPKTAIVTSVAEVNIYRFRNGFYKRIDFIKSNHTGNKVFIHSSDLTLSDEIVISGMSFLRIAELAAFDGAPSGHSH